ncbi:hypothetical protein [Larkinella terrae]|uniref:DUF29 family protein n=1 Tax=Larkinella terrae TaxID=2025311 RepID=A0A7K0EFT9_9BACT|nr:hypothetical protein [Larkinella terrae]MRS60562.1 hypothetical protein [Larkinella terrae]
MEEIMLLRKLVEEHDYKGALALIDHMDEMARDDKINKVGAYVFVLLVHLIKQQAENRTVRSWNHLIEKALDGIHRANKRRKTGGQYLSAKELDETIDERFNLAISEAASEVFEGMHSSNKIAKMIDAEQIKGKALELIVTYEL